MSGHATNGGRALVAGWFSFEEMGATAGDLLARDIACEWLDDAGFSYDVAVAPPFEGGVDWRTANPADYSHVVFVCGPFGNGWPVTNLLERYRECRLVGVNLSMLEPLEAWNPFDVLVERDSSRTARPDVSFVARPSSVPVVGVVLVHPQKEYADGRHEAANAAVERLLANREAACVSIDTRLDLNSTGLRSPAEVESLLRRMDVVVTTRLHGMVLALKNGVPAIAIDPIAGGAKILRQAQVIGWPRAFAADALTDGALQAAFEHCLTPEARDEAAACARRAAEILTSTRAQFVDALEGAASGRPGGRR